MECFILAHFHIIVLVEVPKESLDVSKCIPMTYLINACQILA